MKPMRIELVKAEALQRLRPFLKQNPSVLQGTARARREAALRAYLADVVQAYLRALIDDAVLDPRANMERWLDGVLADAVASAGNHGAVSEAAARYRRELLDVVRSGYLAEIDRRQRQWEAAGMGSVALTPEVLAEEEKARLEFEEAFRRRRQERQQHGGAAEAAPALQPASWQDVSIIFLSDERVQVKRGEEYSTMNYAEFGFEDKRNGKPDQAWVLLREMAENKGVLQKPERRVPEAVLKPARDRDKELHRALEVQTRDWAKKQKHVETIRKRLREHFRIPDGDPIPATAAGYQTAFQLGCGPSYRS